jgi:hypothetical protein
MGDSVTLDGNIPGALLIIASIIWIYLSGRVATRRGRSFRNWAIASLLIGPLTLPLLYLLPNLHDKSGQHA